MSEPADSAAPWHVRIARYLEPRPWLTDTLILVLPLLLWVLLFYSGPYQSGNLWNDDGPWAGAVALEVLTIAPLALRRTNPPVAVGLIAAGALAQVFTLIGPGASLVTVPITVYSAAKFGGRRTSRAALGLGLLGSVSLAGFIIANARFSVEGIWVDPAVVMSLAVVFGFSAMVVVTSWLLGDIAGRRRLEIEAVNERNRLLEREREQEARLAADAERMRIAREMHDVISHSMSVMIAQADGGRYVVHQDPDAAQNAFTTVADTGRSALAQMRRMLGVLREADEHTLRAPMPDHADLPDLVADVRSAGLDATLQMPEAPIPALPDGAGLAVYRIVQEALTNTMKHAGPDATARIELTLEAGALTVTVRDDGLGHRAPDDGSGSGLLGLRERAALYRGQVTTQADEHGFTVIARFPTDSPQESV